MNLTLYQAADKVRELLDQIDPSTGELPAGFEEARAVVATKAIAVAAYMLESEKQIAMIQEAANELEQRALAQRKRVEWLRSYLKSHMKACGITEIKDERGLFKAKLEIGRDEAVEIFDAEQLPSDYMREVPAKSEPDKKLIKKAIDDGFEVPGAKLVKRDRLKVGI
jgi:hypothetical protein